MLEGPELGLIDQDALAAEAADLWQQGFELQRGLYAALLEEDPSLICWLERGRNNPEVSLCTAPLAVDDILRRDLFDTKESVVLTSATLSAEGHFDFLRERLGLDDADELHLGSPFDFERSTLIALPTDLPDPNDSEFVGAVGELLVEAVRASQGRALILFTSYGLLNAVYDADQGAAGDRRHPRAGPRHRRLAASAAELRCERTRAPSSSARRRSGRASTSPARRCRC